MCIHLLAIGLALCCTCAAVSQDAKEATDLAKSSVSAHDAEVRRLETQFKKSLSKLETQFISAAKDSKAKLLDKLAEAQKLAQVNDLDEAIRIRDILRDEKAKDVSVPKRRKALNPREQVATFNLKSTPLLDEVGVKLSHRVSSKKFEFKIPNTVVNGHLLVILRNMADDEGDRGAYYSLTKNADDTQPVFDATENAMLLFAKASRRDNFTLLLEDSDTKMNGISVAAWIVTPSEPEERSIRRKKWRGGHSGHVTYTRLPTGQWAEEYDGKRYIYEEISFNQDVVEISHKEWTTRLYDRGRYYSNDQSTWKFMEGRWVE